MPRNVYFSQAVKSEQNLYEDLIIESLKIYGQDVFYIPRVLVNRDNILGEDAASKFDDAYLIEMYIENVDGFEGSGDLYSKFGLEIQDDVTFVVSRRMWNQGIGKFSSNQISPRPQEGDLIFLPMTNTFFEIEFVEHEDPFYQLKNLPTYKLKCTKFEYSDEKFDTGLAEIDNEIAEDSYKVTIDVNTTNTQFPELGEIVRQTVSTGVQVFGEVVERTKTSATNGQIKIQNIGVTGSNDAKDFLVDASKPLVGDTSTVSVTITKIYGLADATGEAFIDDGAAENITYEAFESGFMDFSESNPFGEP
tara:strand:+ start:1191 stop:2108 length:918 start_codon:yes stop_codon:yes gene_type:complete